MAILYEGQACGAGDLCWQRRKLSNQRDLRATSSLCWRERGYFETGLLKGGCVGISLPCSAVFAPHGTLQYVSFRCLYYEARGDAANFPASAAVGR